MNWTYPAGISQTQECSEATALVKVARHSPCLHGWDLIPNPNSPYEKTRIPKVRGSKPCYCDGALPPKSLKMRIGPQMQTSMQELFVLWPICERCGHALSLHGQLNIEPREERLRRVKVAVRMDELLEDQGKLLDFSYDDTDISSLKKQIHSLSYLRKPLQEKPTATAVIKSTKQPDQTMTAPNKTVPNADVFFTLNYMYRRAFCAAVQSMLYNNADTWENPAKTMRHFFTLAKRAVIRVDPSIKHSICRSCFQPLLEGLTGSTTIYESPRSISVTKQCLHCMNKKKVYTQVFVSTTDRTFTDAFPRRRNLSKRQRRRRWMRSQAAPTLPQQTPTNYVPFAERTISSAWPSPFINQGQMQGLDVKALEEAAMLRGGHCLSVGIGNSDGHSQQNRK